MQPRLIHILYLLPPKTRARNRVKVFFLSSDGKHLYREEAGVSGLAIASSQIAPFFPEHHVFGINVRTSIMLISFEFAISVFFFCQLDPDKVLLGLCFANARPALSAALTIKQKSKTTQAQHFFCSTA